MAEQTVYFPTGATSVINNKYVIIGWHMEFHAKLVHNHKLLNKKHYFIC
jgi:hypothetical protein